MRFTQSRGYRVKKGFIGATYSSERDIWVYDIKEGRWKSEWQGTSCEVGCPCNSVRAFRRLLRKWRAQGDLPAGTPMVLCHEEGDVYVVAVI